MGGLSQQAISTLNSQLSDEELADLFKSGDRAGLDELVKRYLGPIHRKVRQLVPEQDVEDVTQEIFLNLVKSINNFKGRSLFKFWFYKIVVNRVGDYHRGKFREQSRIRPEDEIATEPMAQQPESYLDMEFDELLVGLPKHYRQVLEMKLREELDFPEIAEVLGLSREAIRSRYRRGIQILQARYAVGAGGSNY